MSPKGRKRPHQPASAAEVERLLREVEVELSRSSKAALRELASQLAEADGDGDGDDLDLDLSREVSGSDLDEDIGDRDDEEVLGGRSYSRQPNSWQPYSWRGSDLYAETAPIKVVGGLEARSKRGAIGETWWSRRFLGAMEPYLVGGRGGRGRSYARRGQVVELSVAPGVVSARVQGTQREPYEVKIAMPAATPDQWERVLVSLASQAGYSASMLAGELPHEVEQVFAGAGVPLLPIPGSKLTSDCTCPDWANPCKHVAAVCYLVAEQFDRDPFALLAWRGQGRGEVLSRLRELRGAEVVALGEPAVAAPGPAAPPLAECVPGFWEAGPDLASVQVRPAASEAAGAVLRQLPHGLIDVRGRDLGEVLGPAYKEMAARAATRALGKGGLGTGAFGTRSLGTGG